jgi:protein-tyrosine phosphatase
MNKVFWMLPDKLAGRPGPDREPWDPASLRAGGIGAVLSVNDGRLCHPQDFAALGMAYACVPLSDQAPPRPGDLEHCVAALPRAYDFVQEQIGLGRGVLVHCSSGKDRTGLFLAYWLRRELGLSPAQAVHEVRRVRPIALSAQGWEELGLQVLACVD